MIGGGPLTRLLARRASLAILGLMTLVMAIFIAKSFTTILEETVRNGGSAFDVAILLIFKLPQIVDFALPLAVMLGLYLALTAARDANELIICAAAGVPWTRIPLFAGVVGCVGLCVSLLFAGILTPLSSYALRLALTNLKAQLVVQEITAPGQRNSLRTFQGRTVIATPSQDPTTERGNLFIYHPEPGDGWRISQANDWTVIGPDDAGTYSVQMQGFRELSGAANQDTLPVAEDIDTMADVLRSLTVAVSTITLDFRIEDLVRTVETARRDNETLIYDLVGKTGAADQEPDARALRRFGELLARALLCPVAALLAVAATAWSATRAGRFLALPVATILVLLCDIFGRAALGDAALYGGTVFWGILGAATLIGIGMPLAYILKRGEIIVAPRRGRE